MYINNEKKEIIFGIHAVIETILAGKPISKIWLKQKSSSARVKELIALAKEHHIPHSQVPTAKLQRLTKKSHQGAIAFLAPITFASLPAIIQQTYEKGKAPLIVVLDRIQDVRNLGAIARTAVATGVDALVIGTKDTVSIGGDAMKTSVGALAHIPVCRFGQLAEALTYLQASGLQLVACTEKATQPIYENDFSGPTALLLGGEAQGIAQAHLKMANHHTHIPMQGAISSLNVSVATAVVLYEVIRQRL